jgi:hypothetical protein
MSDNIKTLIGIVQKAYPGTEVLIRTNTRGRVSINNPLRETAEMPASYFAHIYKPNPDDRFPHPLTSHKAYAPTIERALVLAIRLRDPDLLGSVQYIHTPESKDPS